MFDSHLSFWFEQWEAVIIEEQSYMLVVSTLERIAIQERANQGHKHKNPSNQSNTKLPKSSKQPLPQIHILSKVCEVAS